MGRLFEMIQEPQEGDTVQFLGVYALRWQREWGEPTVAFVEVDEERQRLIDAAPALWRALKPFATNAIADSNTDEALYIPCTAKELRAARAAIAQAEGER